MIRVLRTALEDADRSGDGGMARTYLLVDLGAVARRILGRRGASSDGAEALAEMAPEPEVDEGRRGRGRGRSTLSRLFLLGAIVGIGYMMRKREASMDEMVGKATERARTVADETAMRSGEIAGRTETASQEAAERVEEAGEMAADEIEKAGETVESAERAAEEKAEEMTDTGEEGEESEE